MDIKELRHGKRVSVPSERAVQGRPWEEPYGMVVGTVSEHGASVRLDGDAATIIRVRLEDLDEE
jgi:hypothetical protein